MVLITGHGWALKTVTALVKGRIGSKDSVRRYGRPTWSISENDGTEVAIVRLQRGRDGPPLKVPEGAVLFILEGTLAGVGSNLEEHFKPGSVLYLEPGSKWQPRCVSRRHNCLMAVLWVQQPTPA